MEENQRKFTGVFIPAEIYENEELSWSDKILWAEIQALSGSDVCRASNAHFAKHLHCTELWVSQSISKLKKLGLVKQVGFDGKVRKLVVYFGTNDEQHSKDKQNKGRLKENLKADYKKSYRQTIRKVIGSIDIYNNNKYIPSEIQDENNTIVQISDSESIAETKKTKRFIKPTLEDVQNYCQERKNSVDPENFINYYESKGWLVGKSPMKDWKAAVRTWERTGYNQPKQIQDGSLPIPTIDEWLKYAKELKLDKTKLEHVYKAYESAGWRTTKGQKILNWKQIMLFLANDSKYLDPDWDIPDRPKTYEEMFEQQKEKKQEENERLRKLGII